MFNNLIQLAVAVANSPFTRLIEVLQGILLPIIGVVVGGLAIMRGIKGRFMDMIILLVVAFVALIFFLNPTILTNLATQTGAQISGATVN